MKLRLKFLRDCLQEQVILQKHIDITRFEVRELFKISKSARQSFHQTIPEIWKPILLDYCYGKMRRVCKKLSHNLIENSDWSKHTNSNFMINLSDKPLSSDVKCALGYGLSFANQHIDYVDVVKGFCNLEKYGDVPVQDLNICKGLIYSSLTAPNIPNCPRRFSLAYKELKNDKDLHITKAGKSNCLVILNRFDYVDKMKILLNDEVTYSKLNKNPLESVNSEFNKNLKKYLKGNDLLIKQFSALSLSLPYLYGLIKTHKPDNPIRPIISSTGSISYKLSKWLVSILSPIVGSISHIKNNKLNSLNLMI
ncbi:uncharacterized protein LOC143024450 [Oratosquilla oratoria]|uniref:uncharacterized protein LOC143024450 n=1 Tax=Oratosquilla oratoria TaxID=337810 RepID=UPI003F75C3EF